MSDAGAAFKRLLEVLNQLGIRCAVGGSLASSVHGTPRATADIDLVVDIRPAHAPPLAAALEDEFFADQEMIAGSVEAGRAFNLIHYASGYRFDLFPLPDKPYYRVEFERREPTEFRVGEEPLRFDVVTAEDAILAKLVWYRLAGEVSERHWSDASAIVQVQGGKLDEAYLRKWSVHLRVADLLDRLLSQSP